MLEKEGRRHNIQGSNLSLTHPQPDHRTTENNDIFVSQSNLNGSNHIIFLESTYFKNILFKPRTHSVTEARSKSSKRSQTL